MTTGWTTLSGSSIGSVHVRDSLPLQDAVLTWNDPGSGHAVVAVADGHGHKLHFRSDTGAALAVVSAVEELRRILPQLAQAAADIVFLGDSLAPVAETIAIARKARTLMMENLWFAVLYNAVAVPIAVAGFATPLVAAAAMSGSSLVVTLNALRAARQPAAPLAQAGS